MRASTQSRSPKLGRASLRLPDSSSLSGVRSDRAGVALVLFALLIFGFMGIMAVAIDVGIASLTQAQMQNAVDTGAIEGIRLRDFGPTRPQSDVRRRAHVSALVQMVFDDDLHPTGGVAESDPVNSGGMAPMDHDDPDSLNLGAGPTWHLETVDHNPDNVGATLTDPTSVYDDPVLQQNRENQVYGDMISGTYQWGASHLEHDDYTRPDFDVLPADSNVSDRSTCFLVRMRRTNVSGAPDNVDGISSGERALPFIFGLGSAMRGSDDSSARLDGMTVRAVAIASVRPAMTIGPPPNMADRIGNPMQGVGFWYPDSVGGAMTLARPLALSEAFWEGVLTELHMSGEKQLSPDNDPQHPGFLHYHDPLTGQDTVAGMFLDVAAMNLGSNYSVSVGMPIAEGPAPVHVPPITYVDYFPIYRQISSGPVPTNCVIGFGYGTIQYDGAKWTVTKGLQSFDLAAQPAMGWPACASFVAPDNASARLSPDVPALTPAAWTEIFDAYRSLGYIDPTTGATPTAIVFNAHMFDWQYIREGTVLAPVLVR
jgi:hypothetical protein